MARTRLTGEQVTDGTIKRADLDASTAGEAVIRRLIAGFGMSLTSTGPDSGTGDVTVSNERFLGKTLSYTGDKLTSVLLYLDAAKTQLHRTVTLVRTGEVLTSVEIRNSSNVLLYTKTLQYTSNVLTGVTEG